MMKANKKVDAQIAAALDTMLEDVAEDYCDDLSDYLYEHRRITGQLADSIAYECVGPGAVDAESGVPYAGVFEMKTGTVAKFTVPPGGASGPRPVKRLYGELPRSADHVREGEALPNRGDGRGRREARVRRANGDTGRGSTLVPGTGADAGIDVYYGEIKSNFVAGREVSVTGGSVLPIYNPDGTDDVQVDVVIIGVD